MSLRRHLAAGLRTLLWKGRAERDLDDELQAYLDAAVAEKMKDGLSAGEARRAARVEMGSLEAVKDSIRDAGWETHLETVWQDLRYGWRTLWRAPLFTAAVVATLALGIGANTTIFTLVNSTLLRPLPFPDADQLVFVWLSDGPGSNDRGIVSAPDFWDWERDNRVFSGMALFDSAGRAYNLGSDTSGRQAEGVSGLRVSAAFFDVLGVAPFIGRTFRPGEDRLGTDRIVVLTYALWQRRYGGDRAIVGRTIRIDGEPFEVVGIMPPEFQFQYRSAPRQLFVPAGYTEGDRARNSRSFIAFARLRPDVGAAEAQSAMTLIQSRIAEQQPKGSEQARTVVEPMGEADLSGLRQLMILLLSAVGFVLLVACVNVANLLLARGARRRRELAVRRALGATGWRIARQLLIESLMLSALGGAAGLLLAAWGSSLFVRILPGAFSRVPFRPLDGAHVDGAVLAFALVASGLTGLLFGLAPALSAFRTESTDPLSERGGDAAVGRARGRHVLVATEVALTLVVLCGAGLMMASVWRIVGVVPGFDASNVLTMQTAVPQVNTYYGPPVKARFCQDVAEQVGAVPGVRSVGAVAHLPLRGNASRGFEIEGRPLPADGRWPNASYSVACPGYFRTMGIPIVNGREFTDRDTLGSPGVIVINEAMARQFWPERDALGQRIKIGIAQDGNTWLTVVGIVGNTRHWGLDRDIRPQFFRPYTQAAWPWMTIVVRTAAEPGGFAAAAASAVERADPDLPVSSVGTMDEVVAGSVGSRRFAMWLLCGFGLLALALASVGIGAVVSYAVEQRTHEIGIRVALGAGRRDIVRLFVGRSMWWVVAGMTVGLAGSFGLAMLLRAGLVGTSAANPLVLAAVSVVLFVVALLASYLPARRATRLDPVVALRAE